MNVKVVLCLCLCAVVGAGSAKKSKSKPENLEDTYGDLNPEGVDYDDIVGDEEEDDVDVPPDELEKPNVVIDSKPQVFVASIGETVRLPCETTDTESVRTWDKDEKIIYQGEIPLFHMNHTKIYSNGSLDITLSNSSDFGVYICKLLITNDYHPSINHTILEHTPPQITAITTFDNKTVYKPGDTLNLTCHAKGIPKPEITWHKGNPTESLILKGDNLVIPDLKWTDSGMYRCLAANDLRPAAHAHININVIHTPVITTKKYLINSDHKHTAELKCTAHGYPQPTIQWMRNGENVVQSDKIDLRHENRQDTMEKILIIKDLSEEDFGDYVCMAKNSQGKNTQVVKLVKTPAVQEFIKPDKTAKDLVLMWRVESKTPITRHEMQYRKKGEGEWKNVEPDVTEGQDGVYTVKFVLTGLEGGSYETRVRSKNVHGWSPFSEAVPFDGVTTKPRGTHKNHHKNHHKEKEFKEKHISPPPEDIPEQHPVPEQRESTIRDNNAASKTSSTLLLLPLLPCIFLVFLRLD